jgi:hypothetical protein
MIYMSTIINNNNLYTYILYIESKILFFSFYINKIFPHLNIIIQNEMKFV